MIVQDIGGNFEQLMANISLQPDCKKVPLRTLITYGDCRDYIAHLESTLLGNSAQSFKDLKPGEIKENFLFLLFHSAIAKNPATSKKQLSDFSLLLYMLPYAIAHLEGICTPKIMESIDKTSRDVLAALREKIEDELDRQPEFYEQMQPDWQNTQKLLKKIGARYFEEADLQLFVAVLQKWNAAVQPSFLDLTRMAKKLAELSFTLSRKPIDAEYTQNIDKLYLKLLENLQVASPEQIQIAEMQLKVQYALAGVQYKPFSTYPDNIKVQFFVLFLHDLATTKSHSNFRTLAHIVPYYFNQVGGFCTPELMAASNEAFSTVLTELVEQPLPPDSWENIQTLLTRFSLDTIKDPIPDFALALARWVRITHPKPKDAATLLLNFAQCAAEWITHTESEARWEIFKQMTDTVDDDNFMLQLLYELCKSDPDHPTACGFDESWALELEAKQREELRLFVELLNRGKISIFKVTLNPAEEELSMHLALRVVPSLESSTVEQLLVILDQKTKENLECPLIQRFVDAANLPTNTATKKYSYAIFLIKQNSPSSLYLAARILTSIGIRSIKLLLSELEASIKEHTNTVYHQKALHCLFTAKWIKDTLSPLIHTVDETSSVELQNQLNTLSFLTKSEQTLSPAIWRAKIEQTLFEWKHNPNGAHPRPLLPEVLKSAVGLRDPIFKF